MRNAASQPRQPGEQTPFRDECGRKEARRPRDVDNSVPLLRCLNIYVGFEPAGCEVGRDGRAGPAAAEYDEGTRLHDSFKYVCTIGVRHRNVAWHPIALHADGVYLR